LALYRTTGIVTFHAPMACAPLTGFSRDHFERVLGRNGPPGRLGRLPSPSDVLVPRSPRILPLRKGTAEGPLVGGNLSLVAALIGTRYFPDLDGAILFLEDVGEDLYRIDRMLAQLRMVGALDRLAGVILGRFTDMKRGTSDGALGFDEVLSTSLTRSVSRSHRFPDRARGRSVDHADRGAGRADASRGARATGSAVS
jgi:muramoyltetrapeptide carboxypeptidase